MKKKLVFFLLAAILSLIAASCKHSTQPVNLTSDLTPERVVSLDKEYMFTNYKADYTWFESCILLNDYLDKDCDGSIAGITNIFQAISEKDKGFNTEVVMITHTSNGNSEITSAHSFWVEDFPLNNTEITITYKQAFEKVMATNCIKPHSRYVVLRKEVGPYPANPQYIFGNSKMQIYVDATTGVVSEVNPAFTPPNPVKQKK